MYHSSTNRWKIHDEFVTSIKSLLSAVVLYDTFTDYHRDMGTAQGTN